MSLIDCPTARGDYVLPRITERYVAEAYIRQAPLPKGNDPHEWAGWPLFEAYGLAGDGRPCSTRGKNNG